MHILTRRELVRLSAAAGAACGATWLALRLPPDRMARAERDARLMASSPTGSAEAPLKALTRTEYLVLVAAAERIFPRDEIPGATDLGVASYVDRALAEARSQPWASGFREGLARLDAESEKRFSVPFHRVAATDQDALIAAWGRGADPPDKRFVHNLIVATLEGALCDPTYGGNAECQGWKMLGVRPDPFAPSKANAR
ncbi:MAG: gluconate 2-dehydrogenase subunit 3 family protein [Polyangiaceae bacterium]